MNYNYELTFNLLMCFSIQLARNFSNYSCLDRTNKFNQIFKWVKVQIVLSLLMM